jgi:hypothetical protein
MAKIKFHPLEKDETRFTKERLGNTVAILFIITLPIVIVSIFLKWEIIITIWAWCMFLTSISFLVYKIYVFLKSKFM